MGKNRAAVTWLTIGENGAAGTHNWHGNLPYMDAHLREAKRRSRRDWVHGRGRTPPRWLVSSEHCNRGVK
jgi:hypothetical protein